MLENLEIKNFRTFSHLRIERLGQVNLIVGKNGVGKTTLLEALQLYGSIWPQQTITKILYGRAEILDRQARASMDLPTPPLLHLETLFYGREPKNEDVFMIGPLTLAKGQLPFCAKADTRSHQDGYFGININPCTEARQYSVYADHSSTYSIPSGTPKPPEVFPDPPYVSSRGNDRDVPSWWDDLPLDSEQRVLESLKQIAPIRGAKFVPDPRDEIGRLAKVTVGGEGSLPLTALGDGAVRMFQIAVAMEFAVVQGKTAFKVDEMFGSVLPILLIDEIETGIHHTLHADLWKFVFHAARLLGVQVFATSHSLDCLRGFGQAMEEDDEAEGLVIRLEEVEGEEETGAVIVDREDLPIVIRDSIEVR